METDSDQLIFGQLGHADRHRRSLLFLNGNYGLNVSGVDGNKCEADFVGQFDSGGTSTLTAGTLDINDEDLLSTTPTIPNSAISGGSYTFSNKPLGTARSISLPAGAPFQFAFYFVSPSQAFMLQIDNNSSSPSAPRWRSQPFPNRVARAAARICYLDSWNEPLVQPRLR